MASAFALGHDSLRLRSRRARSGRSHRVSPSVVIVVIAVATGIGYVGAQSRAQSEPVVDAATIEQQRFVADLRPIEATIQHGVAEEGLLVAAYESGQIDRPELQRRLGEVLTSYRSASADLQNLVPPAALQSTVLGEQQALSDLATSGAQLSQAYDDGDRGRVSEALAASLSTTARLHGLTDVVAPTR